MAFGFGRGGGRGFGGGGRGMGFGFRGSSPPWPYIGRGRGGLPRCGYFAGGAAGAPVQPYYPADAGYSYAPGAFPQYAAAPPAWTNTPAGPGVSPEQELDFLKDQAETIHGQLEQIESRMRDLESEK